MIHDAYQRLRTARAAYTAIEARATAEVMADGPARRAWLDAGDELVSAWRALGDLLEPYANDLGRDLRAPHGVRAWRSGTSTVAELRDGTTVVMTVICPLMTPAYILPVANHLGAFEGT